VVTGFGEIAYWDNLFSVVARFVDIKWISSNIAL